MNPILILRGYYETKEVTPPAKLKLRIIKLHFPMHAEKHCDAVAVILAIPTLRVVELPTDHDQLHRNYLTQCRKTARLTTPAG
jgi:hypothetical protein